MHSTCTRYSTYAGPLTGTQLAAGGETCTSTQLPASWGPVEGSEDHLCGFQTAHSAHCTFPPRPIISLRVYLALSSVSPSPLCRPWAAYKPPWPDPVLETHQKITRNGRWLNLQPLLSSDSDTGQNDPQLLRIQMSNTYASISDRLFRQVGTMLDEQSNLRFEGVIFPVLVTSRFINFNARCRYFRAQNG